VKVKAADGYIYYMAQALLDAVLGSLAQEGKAAYEILESYKGTDLEYKEYEPLFACAGEEAERQGKKAHYVTCDSYVTMSDGTGIVHIAPAFGEDDANVGRKYGLPLVQFVDGKGHMTEQTPYAGMFVKDADPEIIKDLDKEGKLFSAPKFEHDYPFCWRCDTPLIYYARESWFIKMTAVKDDLVRNNKTINWIPPTIGEGRFGNWLENIQDWGISRNRYWGTPLNIWECECGNTVSVGSRAELAALAGDENAGKVELHRPYIDEVTFPCPKCGKTMRRVPEVIDCWFDSGAMPFAQHHYPFENKDLFEQQFPAKFISEAVDQTRGWFYSLLAESTLLFNKAPYENVIVLGLVADEDGQKMSKSKGNVVDPFEALAEYGADAIRWYFYSSCAPWLPKRFSGKTVLEGQHKFLDKLWNTYTFFVLYANIDGFDAAQHTLEYDKLPVMDKWLLSRLYTTVGEVDNNLDKYRITEAAKALQDFVEEMSNWYVRRSRERFWAKGMEQDKINAYMTLHTALVTVCKAAAPMIPFMTEEIYRNLVCSTDSNAPESIHLCDFPKAEEGFIDKKLEADMEEVLEAVVLGRACRNAAAIKNRQPIGRMYVKMAAGTSEGATAEAKTAKAGLDSFYTTIIEDELNVKQVVYTEDVRDYTTYTFKPQLRTVGPKYGKQLGGIQKVLASLDGNVAMDELNVGGKLCFEVNGANVELTKDDLIIDMTQKEGYVSQENGKLTVVLDTNLTEELIEEGFVFELISKIQTMRKDAGFEVMDHIKVSVNGNGKLAEIAARNKDSISGKVLAEELTSDADFAVAKEWNVNGEKVTIAIEKV
jgi:isoleucyl-tRNA synthetase